MKLQLLICQVQQVLLMPMRQPLKLLKTSLQFSKLSHHLVLLLMAAGSSSNSSQRRQRLLNKQQHLQMKLLLNSYLPTVLLTRQPLML